MEDQALNTVEKPGGGYYDFYAPLPPLPVRTYTRREGRLALLCWGLGYLFWRWAAPTEGGVTAALWAAAFLGVQGWFAAREGGRPGRWLPFGITALFSLPFLLFDRGPLMQADLFFLLLTGTMGILWSYDVPRWDWADPLRGLLLRPFSCFGAGASALFAKQKEGEKRRISGIWWGLLAAVPVTLLVGGLLAAADGAFSNLLTAIFTPLREWGLQPVQILLRLAGGIPVGLYFFGAIYANRHREEEILTDEAWERTRIAPRKIPATVLLGMGLPVCVLYALFILSQSAYYFSAFSGLLPEGFTYAQYARRGFFELCAVAVINLLLLVGAGLFCRRQEERLPRSLRIWGAALCGFTLLLIATALRKMVLYIGEYGLTPLRVYTSWFMVLLGICFLILAVCRFFPRIRPAKPLAAAFLLMFALLQFSGVDGLIADYNVDRYLAGDLKTVDVSLFYRLGDGAVPAAVRLVRDRDQETALQAAEFIAERQNSWKTDNWMSFNLTTLRAKHAVAAADLPADRVLIVELGEVGDPVYGLTAACCVEGVERSTVSVAPARGGPMGKGDSLTFRLTGRQIPPGEEVSQWNVRVYVTVDPYGEWVSARGKIDLADWPEGERRILLQGDRTGGFTLVRK